MRYDYVAENGKTVTRDTQHTDLAVPTVHLNGTSKEALLEQLGNAVAAIHSRPARAKSPIWLLEASSCSRWYFPR